MNVVNISFKGIFNSGNWFLFVNKDNWFLLFVIYYYYFPLCDVKVRRVDQMVYSFLKIIEKDPREYSEVIEWNFLINNLFKDLVIDTTQWH